MIYKILVAVVLIIISPFLLFYWLGALLLVITVAATRVYDEFEREQEIRKINNNK